jgi:hypothetical protein
MSQSTSSKPDPVLEGVELLLHQKGRSASFGTKMALSLNGVDLGCMNSITRSTCRAKCSNILHDSLNKDKSRCENISYHLLTRIISEEISTFLIKEKLFFIKFFRMNEFQIFELNFEIFF